MIVAAKMFAITVILSVFGVSSAWCDSCGIMSTENFTPCDTCDAYVCDYCVEDFEPEHGCFVCEEN